MKKNKFILGVVACAFAALAMTGCSLTLGNSDDRVVTSGYKLTSISLDTTNVTKDFIRGAKFSYEGLVVNGTYADNSTKVIKDYSVSTPDMYKCEEQTVTVTAADNATATYKITVSLPVKFIAVDGKTYEVTATYEDNSTSKVNAEWSYSEPDLVATYLGKTATVAVPKGDNIKKAYDAGVSVKALYDAGVSVKVLYDAGVSVKALYDAGISAKAMHDAGISYEAIVNVGVSITDLITDCKDYEVGVKECNTAWKAGPDTTVANGETSTCYFVNYGSGAKIYNNFIVEVRVDNGNGFTLRCDNWGWGYGVGTNLSVEDPLNDEASTKSKVVTGTLNWEALAQGQVVKLVISNIDGKVTITCTSPNQAGWSQVYNINNNGKDSILWHLNVDNSHLIALKNVE